MTALSTSLAVKHTEQQHAAEVGPRVQKQAEATQPPARTVSQMVRMRTVITYLAVGLTERGHRKDKNEISET